MKPLAPSALSIEFDSLHSPFFELEQVALTKSLFWNKKGIINPRPFCPGSSGAVPRPGHIIYISAKLNSIFLSGQSVEKLQKKHDGRWPGNCFLEGSYFKNNNNKKTRRGKKKVKRITNGFFIFSRCGYRWDLEGNPEY